MADTVEGGIDRRASLLRAGRAVLAQKGLEATRVSEIVAHAGVAQGTFYLYFPSKLSLVAALFGEFNEQALFALRQAMASAPDLSTGVLTGVQATFAVMQRYRDVLGIIYTRIGDREVWEACHEQEVAALDFIAQLIAEAQARGEVAPELDPHITADLLSGVIEHAGHRCFIHQTHAATPEYIDQVATLIRRALGIVAHAN